jgi:hypothetical protein
MLVSGGEHCGSRPGLLAANLRSISVGSGTILIIILDIVELWNIITSLSGYSSPGPYKYWKQFPGCTS